jgi:flagellar basal-body rod modification protein FlgD
MGEDDFLLMLVTQLNYQDPMDPLDSQAFAAQLAQFTSVEQLISINQNLQDSLTAQMLLNQSISNTMNAQLIGMEVTASNEIVQYNDGQTTPIMYNLPGTAQTVTITIKDENGAEVRTINLGTQSAGDHTYTWDGNNNNGIPAPEGDYTFTVTASASEGNQLAVQQFITGIITSITYDEGQAVLQIGDLPVYLSNVTALAQPGQG